MPTIDGHVGQLQADDPVVGIEHHLPHRVHYPEVDPLVAPAAQGGVRARLVGDPPVGAAENQHLQELLEDHPVGYAGAVAAPSGWSTSLSGSRAQNCSQIGSMKYDRIAGMGTRSFFGKLQTLPG